MNSITKGKRLWRSPLTSDSMCSLCNKKIGTSFAVYPNGKTIVHFVCFRDSQSMKAVAKGTPLRRRWYWIFRCSLLQVIKSVYHGNWPFKYMVRSSWEEALLLFLTRLEKGHLPVDAMLVLCIGTSDDVVSQRTSTVTLDMCKVQKMLWFCRKSLLSLHGFRNFRCVIWQFWCCWSCYYL